MKIGDDQLEQVDTMKCLGAISSDGGTYVCRGIEVRIGGASKIMGMGPY